MSNCKHGVNNKYCKICTKKPDELTKEQISNWRSYLALNTKVGAYAFIMPVNLIIKYKNMVQAKINKIVKEV